MRDTVVYRSSLAQTLTRNNDFEKVVRSVARLSDYGPDSWEVTYNDWEYGCCWSWY